MARPERKVFVVLSVDAGVTSLVEKMFRFFEIFEGTVNAIICQ